MQLTKYIYYYKINIILNTLNSKKKEKWKIIKIKEQKKKQKALIIYKDQRYHLMNKLKQI